MTALKADTAVSAVDVLLERAVQIGASDIHYDPTESGGMVRFRVDGLLQDGGRIDVRLHEEIIARLKILAGARTDVHAVPQDGRWRAAVRGRAYMVRASFMPTYHGENAVMRILPAGAREQVSFERLGFAADHAALLRTALRASNGLILVSGPTGSGKTTTLHACVAHKAQEAISVITLEDPVEYEIHGVRQVHIRHSHGVTFATGLRAALRQDPDVIMVGEIRDAETARTAVHMALTGHLVLSTIHTNSALDSIPRLVDMGVDRYLLASTLRLVVGQRLIRMKCSSCATEGCGRCRQTGYAGRSVIAEMCAVDEDLAQHISRGASPAEYAEHARMRGFRTLQEDGARAVEAGITTSDEIMRMLYE